MDIIFMWDSQTYNKGVFLSGKYEIIVKSEEKSIIIKRNDKYVKKFWGKNIQDCFAIVGENGAGKTMLVNEIMYAIRDIKLGVKGQEDFLLIFEDEKLNILYFICMEDLKNWTIDVTENIDYQFITDPTSILNNYEVAYFHNALNVRDYLAQGRCKYDFSLGHQIYKCQSTTHEMYYNYNDISKDVVINFFENATFRIVEFLYDYALHNDLNIDFPIPKYISIGVENYYDVEYILEQAKGLRVDRDEEDKLSEDIEKFSNGVNNIIRVYGRTWINYTIRNLIYGVFKEICIPTTVPNKITYNHVDFFEACLFLCNTKKLSNMSIYQCAYTVIGNLRYKFKKEGNYIDNFEKYIQWLEKNQDQITLYADNDLMHLEIHVEKKTEDFITQLICLYSKVNLSFPFYKFSFGVSTGEYYFLSIFSNIYLIQKYRENRLNACKGNKNVLLILDEVDLSLHPKWQRMFMKWLAGFCEYIFIDISIKIIVTTHSPILLSDFPGNSVLYIMKYENKDFFYKSNQQNTFGCNIHSLFLNSFFLENYGTMGAFAENKINKIIEKINKGEIEQENLEEIEKTIDYIGEGIIKNKLEIALQEKEPKKKNVVRESEKTVIKETIQQLKGQKKYLEQMISNLEETINDKN